MSQTITICCWYSLELILTILERICVLSKNALQELAEFEFDHIHLNNDGEPTRASASATLKTTFHKIEDLMLSDEEFGVAIKLRDVLLRFSLMTKCAESFFCHFPKSLHLWKKQDSSWKLSRVYQSLLKRCKKLSKNDSLIFTQKKFY